LERLADSYIEEVNDATHLPRHLMVRAEEEEADYMLNESHWRGCRIGRCDAGSSAEAANAKHPWM
jgi:hypothetical protein